MKLKSVYLKIILSARYNMNSTYDSFTRHLKKKQYIENTVSIFRVRLIYFMSYILLYYELLIKFTVNMQCLTKLVCIFLFDKPGSLFECNLRKSILIFLNVYLLRMSYKKCTVFAKFKMNLWTKVCYVLWINFVNLTVNL